MITRSSRSKLKVQLQKVKTPVEKLLNTGLWVRVIPRAQVKQSMEI